MNKTLIMITVFTFLIAFIASGSTSSICNEEDLILINGNNSPSLSPGESLNFSWNDTNCSNERWIKVWKESNKSHIYMCKNNNITNPLIKGDGFDSPGDYTVKIHCSGSPGSNYTGYFTIKEPEESSCHECHKPEPYTGPIFVTHITTLTVRNSS